MIGSNRLGLRGVGTADADVVSCEVIWVFGVLVEAMVIVLDGAAAVLREVFTDLGGVFALGHDA